MASIAAATEVLDKHVGIFWLCPADTEKGKKYTGGYCDVPNCWQKGPCAEHFDGYFDSRKPCVLYAHGWQPMSMQVGKIPCLKVEGYDGALGLLARGYNVGIIRWTPYADAKIVGHAGDKVFSAIDLTYRDEKGNKLTVPEGCKYFGKTVADALLEQFPPLLRKTKQWIVTGQSLGGSVALKTAQYLLRNHEYVSSVWVHDGYFFRKKWGFTTTDSRALTGEIARELVANDIPVVFLRHTDMVESIGVVNDTLKEVGVYVRIRPEHLPNSMLQHQQAFAWWTRTADTPCGSPEKIPQFHTPRHVLLNMCRCSEWFEQIEGTKSQDVSLHIFEKREAPYK